MARTKNAPRRAPKDAAGAESLWHRVREQIEGMILSGELPPGARLNENSLAAKLSVSRGPIREATRFLEEAGLLTTIHNRGAFVRRVDLEEILHVYDVRAGLAYAAGKLAANRATKADIAELRSLWEQMEKAGKEQEGEKYYEINRLFHEKIVGISNNPRLIEFNATTEREVFLFLRRGVAGPSRLSASNLQHRQIIDAIAAGDEIAAATAFENHIAAGKQRMLNSLGARRS